VSPSRPWRDLFLEEVDRQRAAIRRARELGQTWLVFATVGRFDPTRISDHKADQIARREASHVCDLAINMEVEQRRRKGRPLDGLVDEVRAAA